MDYEIFIINFYYLISFNFFLIQEYSLNNVINRKKKKSRLKNMESGFPKSWNNLILKFKFDVQY